MGEDVYAAGGGRVRRLLAQSGEVLCEAAIDGCGAVCARGDAVFAAGGAEGVIYQLDDRLFPCGMFAGGPGMSALRISRDARRLYVLLSDADSVLMLCGRDGAPLLLARAGANPRQMRLDGEGACLAVAGGRDGSASLLCAHTLRTLRTCRGEGLCCDALRCGRWLCALMLTPSLNTRLMLWDERGECAQLSFPGEPGSLCALGKMMLVCAGQWLYVFDAAGMRLRRKRFLGGGPCRLICAGRRLLLLRPAQETLSLLHGGGERLLCDGAQDAAGE